MRQDLSCGHFTCILSDLHDQLSNLHSLMLRDLDMYYMTEVLSSCVLSHLSVEYSIHTVILQDVPFARTDFSGVSVIYIGHLTTTFACK